MKKYLLKISGLATLVLLLHVHGFAQKPRTARAGGDNDTASNRLDQYDEIVIKRKGDKDTKVTIEIKNGQVLVDGKPVSEYDNDDLSIRKKKIRVIDGRGFSFSGPEGAEAFVMPEMPEMPEVPEAAMSPFRNRGGTWNFDGDDFGKNSNRALLGVTSEKPGPGEKGAKITQVNKGSAAVKAGLQIGDVITKIDELAVEDPESLSDAIHKYKPEDKVTVTFKRDGKEQKVTAALGKAKMAQVYGYGYRYPMPRVEGFDYKGLTAPRGLAWNNGQPRLGIKAQDTEEGKGVKVLDVDDESAAEKAGIKEGDIIMKFDGKEVNSAADLADGARAAKDKASFKVNLLRDGKPQEIEVKIPKKLKTANL